MTSTEDKIKYWPEVQHIFHTITYLSNYVHGCNSLVAVILC